MKESIYRSEGREVKVLFLERSVHITNDAGLWALLEERIGERTEGLVTWIGEQYHDLFGRALQISADSLAVEIWGHVYFEYYLLIIKELVRLRLVGNLLERVLDKSAVIDCGEAGLDSNRGFWDMLAPHKDFILKMLPGKIDPQRHKGGDAATA